MDATAMKDCQRQSDHVFQADSRGVERCAFCNRPWSETVRGFGLTGDLPGRMGKYHDLNKKLNAEAGPPIV